MTLAAVTDPFGTAGLRRAVLDAWAASPARFREDANTEEDHAHGYYRDRVIVELAQNAADAAVTAREQGHLLFVLHHDDGGFALTASNTGAPLTREGVRALATMRASAKRHVAGSAPQTVGRFGVGFAAVRSVSDSIMIATRTASDAPADPSVPATATSTSVRFDLSETQAALAELTGGEPAAAASVSFEPAAPADRELVAPTRPASASPELARAIAERGDELPILRLPFAGTGAPEAEFTTSVVLRLRDDHAVAAVRKQLANVDELLLLALPGLDRISVSVPDEPVRTLTLTPGEWTSVRVSGELSPDMLAERPIEERERAEWSVTWAVPPPRIVPAPVVHAPTATDEPCTLPATLIASFPLEPSRRHVAQGAATDAIVREASRAYAELAGTIARAGGDALALVPTGLPAGWLDAALYEGVLSELRRVPLFATTPPAPAAPFAEEQPPQVLLRAADACVLTGPLAAERDVVALLGQFVSDLVWVAPARRPAARLLGASTRSLADVVESLPRASTGLLDVLAQHADEPGVGEALAGLPVELVDGRIVRGPRGVVVPQVNTSATLEPFARWGLRVADPVHAHPVWLRLGAIEGAPAELLDVDPIRQAIAHLPSLLDTASVRDDLDPDDAQALDAVVGLVHDATLAGAPLSERAREALAGLPLESEDGELEAARDLVVPGSTGDRLFEGLIPVSAHEVDRWGEQTLAALGVRTTAAVLQFSDVVAEHDAEPDDDGLPDGWPEYLAFLAERLGDGAYLGDVRAVADLDVVGDDAWDDFLTLIAGDPALRAALLDPVRGEISYTAWWLRDHFGAPYSRPGAVVPYLAEAPEELRSAAHLDAAVWHALGALGALGDLSPADWEVVLDELPDVGVLAEIDVALEFWAALAAAATTAAAGTTVAAGMAPGATLPPPAERIVALTASGPRVVSADDVVVSPEPMWAQPGRDGQLVAETLEFAGALVPAPDSTTAVVVADLLDVDVLSNRGSGIRVLDRGARTELPPAVTGVVARLTPRGRPEVPPVPTTWIRHDGPFRVGRPAEEAGGVGADPTTARASWWVSADGELHASGPTGLASALAQLAGIWRDRHTIEQLLLDAQQEAQLLTETAWN